MTQVGEKVRNAICGILRVTKSPGSGGWAKIPGGWQFKDPHSFRDGVLWLRVVSAGRQMLARVVALQMPDGARRRGVQEGTAAGLRKERSFRRSWVLPVASGPYLLEEQQVAVTFHKLKYLDTIADLLRTKKSPYNRAQTLFRLGSKVGALLRKLHKTHALGPSMGLDSFLVRSKKPMLLTNVCFCGKPGPTTEIEDQERLIRSCESVAGRKLATRFAEGLRRAYIRIGNQKQRTFVRYVEDPALLVRQARAAVVGRGRPGGDDESAGSARSKSKSTKHKSAKSAKGKSRSAKSAKGKHGSAKPSKGKSKSAKDKPGSAKGRRVGRLREGDSSLLSMLARVGGGRE